MQMTEKLSLDDAAVLPYQFQVASVITFCECGVTVLLAANMSFIRSGWYMSDNINLERYTQYKIADMITLLQ